MVNKMLVVIASSVAAVIAVILMICTICICICCFCYGSRYRVHIKNASEKNAKPMLYSAEQAGAVNDQKAVLGKNGKKGAVNGKKKDKGDLGVLQPEKSKRKEDTDNKLEDDIPNKDNSNTDAAQLDGSKLEEDVNDGAGYDTPNKDDSDMDAPPPWGLVPKGNIDAAQLATSKLKDVVRPDNVTVRKCTIPLYELYMMVKWNQDDGDKCKEYYYYDCVEFASIREELRKLQDDIMPKLKVESERLGLEVKGKKVYDIVQKAWGDLNLGNFREALEAVVNLEPVEEKDIKDLRQELDAYGVLCNFLKGVSTSLYAYVNALCSRFIEKGEESDSSDRMLSFLAHVGVVHTQTVKEAIDKKALVREALPIFIKRLTTVKDWSVGASLVETCTPSEFFDACFALGEEILHWDDSVVSEKKWQEGTDSLFVKQNDMYQDFLHAGYESRVEQKDATAHETAGEGHDDVPARKLSGDGSTSSGRGSMDDDQKTDEMGLDKVSPGGSYSVPARKLSGDGSTSSGRGSIPDGPTTDELSLDKVSTGGLYIVPARKLSGDGNTSSGRGSMTRNGGGLE